MFGRLVETIKRWAVGLWNFGERIGARIGEKTRLRHRVGEICFGMVFVGLIPLWFDPVCTPGFDAFTFPLLGSARMWPHLFTPLSYGLLGTILCVVGCISWRRGWRTAVLWTIFFLFLLGVTFLLEISCWEPSWLRAAVDGGTDFQRCYKFEVVQTLPDTVEGVPEQGLTGVVDGLFLRLGTGVAAISYGWYYFLFSLLLCFVAGFARFNFWPALKASFLPALVILVLCVGVQVWQPIYGELQVAAGSDAAAKGDLDAAIHHFRRAIAVDKWNRLQSGVYSRIGAVYEAQGQRDKPEYHLYRALRYSQAANIEQALFEWQQALPQAEGALSDVIRREIVNLTMVYGAQLYTRGQMGDAKRMLEIATTVWPQQLSGYYLDGMCYFELADYYTAIGRFKEALLHTSEPSLIADIRSCLGDCYFKLGDVETARRYYLASIAADNEHNFRGLKSLTETYYK
ncbi:MAG: tetratricopeptide repeat protein [Verrucomicrobia bacterium]|nr:tetratricopeptide repeat protein [Verrucomicrobiota bacterium]